jgi:glycerol-3-phosphate dehydrogenase
MTAIAPHLITAMPQLTPSFGRLPQPETGVLELGVRIGDAMRAAAGTSHRRLPRMRRIGAEEARQWVPALTGARLRGGILSWDGRLEDDARLVVALARTAAAHGAQILTYAEATRITGDGATARDALTGERFEIRARQVINATGVWAGTLVDGVELRPSKGSHLLVPAGRLGYPRALLHVAIPGHFGRFVFAGPRPDGLVLVGLTDDPHDSTVPEDAPQVTPDEEAFLLETVSRAFDRELTSDDVVGRYAGLRPLIDGGDGATADVSREHAVIEDAATGAVTVVGGKLTTYRQMAQDAVDAIAARAGVRAGPCVTATLPLVGAQPYGTPPAGGLPPRLVRRFGSEAADIAALASDRPELLEPVAPGVPILGVELLAAVEREGALTAADVLEIRTRAALVPAWLEAAATALERIVPDLVPYEDVTVTRSITTAGVGIEF